MVIREGGGGILKLQNITGKIENQTDEQHFSPFAITQHSALKTELKDSFFSC